jgi:hypothetical protein
MGPNRTAAALALALAALGAQAQTTPPRQAAQAERDATVADETHARTPVAAPSYGPVLTRRDAPGQQAAPTPVPGRKDPAEVHDETDTLARPAPQSATLNAQQQQQQKPAPQTRRRPAAQAAGPMAPRPLRAPEALPSAGVPIPPPAAAPQPVVPTSTAVRGCQGSFCTDASGGSFNTGGGAAGVNSSGRLCTRSGATVQCF